MKFSNDAAEGTAQHVPRSTEILEAVLDPVLILDGRLRVRAANTAFYETFNLDAERTVGRDLEQIAETLGQGPRLRERLREVHDQGRACRNEEVTCEAGPLGRRTMLMNASAVEGAESGEHLVLLAMKDITARRDAEERLRQSEQKLRMIFENAREFAIIGMDLDGRVTAWNRGAERLLGYEESEILGQSADIIFTHEARAQGEPQRELHAALSEGRAENERWHVRKDGSWFWGSGLVMPLYDHGADPKGLIKIMRDMTPEHKLRQQREAHAAELERRVAEATADAERRAERLETLTRHLHQAERRERRRLARVLHDDLQQLLVASHMRVQMLDRHGEPAALLEETRSILEQAIATSRSLSHELSPAILWERGFVPALHWLAQTMRERHHLSIEVDAEASRVAEVSPEVGDTLLQMVRELLFNVVKHAETPRAWLSLDPMGERGLRLTVADDGVGCDPAMLEVKSRESGHGLQGVRERLGIWDGELHIEKRPGGGCRAIIEVPELPTP